MLLLTVKPRSALVSPVDPKKRSDLHKRRIFHFIAGSSGAQVFCFGFRTGPWVDRTAKRVSETSTPEYLYIGLLKYNLPALISPFKTTGVDMNSMSRRTSVA